MTMETSKNQELKLFTEPEPGLPSWKAAVNAMLTSHENGVLVFFKYTTYGTGDLMDEWFVYAYRNGDWGMLY